MNCRPAPAFRRLLLLCCGALLLLAFSADGASALLLPEDLEYRGAFRLPQDGDWTYGGTGLTYWPGGDAGGAADGYPGSLFGTGNDQRCDVSEVSIPAPVISPSRSAGDLPTAATIQPFADVKQGIFRGAEDGLPLRCDLAWLPAEAGQTSGKLHLTWGEHYQYEQAPSHAWSELTLRNPEVQGPWYLADVDNFASNDYLFTIPQAWADTNTPGLRLATGRFRDGSLGGSGPSLFAYGPWLDGNPPAPNARLTHVTPLLRYGHGYIEEERTQVMQGYTSADEWSGGAWLTAGTGSAVVFAGTKGRGNFWYGFSNGLVWPDDPPYPDFPPAPHDERGWWAESFEGVLYFYNPDDLARVAAGTMAPYEPQPSASMSLEPYLWKDRTRWEKMRAGAIAFDEERGFLYIAEPFADGEQPIVHVFFVRAPEPGRAPAPVMTAGSPPVQVTAAAANGLPAPGEDQHGDDGAPSAQAPGFACLAALAGLTLPAALRRFR